VKKIQIHFVLLVSMVLFSKFASAQDQYLMTGAAKFQKSTDFHDLPFPVNPIGSGVLSFDGKVFIFSYSGESCSVQMDRKMNFYFDPVISHKFGSPLGFARFLNEKFHLSYKNIKEIYLLGDTTVPLCRGFRNSMIYKADNYIILLDGPWAYAFQRKTRAPINAEKSLDCEETQTEIERLICDNPALTKLDAMVNRGFVAMQVVDSEEISYQDPVRVGQINWLKSVRNKCKSRSCLFDAYRARVKYIKSKISSAYPSYPAEESDQDGD
jgi:hypothetical protein